MSTDATSTTTNKRKPDSDTVIISLPTPITRKRPRKTIINDPLAISFLKELGLTQRFFNSGTVLAWGLLPNDPDYLRVSQYVQNGQEVAAINLFGAGNFKLEIQSILRIIPTVSTFQDADIPMNFEDDPAVTGMKRMMLWHGTKRSNLKSILQNGLLLPKHGGAFGAGIYFADNVLLSHSYTDWDPTGNYIFLNDVLLGNSYKPSSADSSLRQPPSINLSPWWKLWGEQQLVPCQSVMWDTGCGPNPLGNVTIDGCTWPLGNIDGWSNMNQYIVYNVKQVRPKFLVKVKYTSEDAYLEM